MKNFFKRCCTFICLLAGLEAGSQNEASKWYFGNLAAVDFATSPPTVINGSSLYSMEGCASIATGAGNLLFYTDGMSIWNQANAVMANGSGLLGNSSSTQSSVIIKKPGSSSQYYVFTTDAVGGPNGLQYSTVDMSLAAGMGSVTVKNVPLYAPTTEKLAAVGHCNGVDAWVLTHELNSNNFLAHLVTATGVSSPVITSLGTVHTFSAGYWVGAMKFSPNGKKLGVCVVSNTDAYFELYDFNPMAGVVSNSLSIGPYGVITYGCDFSPDGSKFYGTLPVGQLKQFDLCAGSDAAILASEYSFTTAAAWGIQLAPDGKIYTSGWGSSSLGVINNPNLAGAACNYNPAGLSIGSGTCVAGLPNFCSSFLRVPLPPFTHTVNMAISCNTASFTAPAPVITTQGCTSATNYTSVSWVFGDPSSGAANTSTLANPVHVYTAPGSYTPMLVLYSDCTSDTIREPVSIISPTISIAGSPTLCTGQSLTLTASGAGTYTWNNSMTGASIVVSPGANTVYTVSSISANGDCSAAAGITINVSPSPTLVTSSSFTICIGGHATLTATGAPSITWSPVSSSTSSVVVSPTVTTYYTVTGTATNGCSSSRVMTVSVMPCTGVAEIAANKELFVVYPNPCHRFLFITSPGAAVADVYDLAGNNQLSNALFTGENKLDLQEFKPGIYLVKLRYSDHIKVVRIAKVE